MDSKKYPPNVPKKLISMFEKFGRKQRALARELKVNPGHINKLFLRGVEPADPDIRKKLFLPTKVRPPLAAWVGQATDILAALEEKASPAPNRTYSRKGKRVR